AEMTPLLAMHSLGHTFVPPPIHAGGLRYHGVAPLVSHAINLGLANPRAVDQLDVYDAGVLFARCEGIIPAPESSHAIAAAIQEANLAREEGMERVILFNLSGHGLMDLTGYDSYFRGNLVNYPLPEEEIAKSIAMLSKYPKPAKG
ncbi:MAG TPA: TrpB-like pyridoxal-phosphate dependent enzyme, partial [bacterium]|nr:TrpB-like pyridoxal-phosphate dependent enzyme [bacterium]